MTRDEFLQRVESDSSLRDELADMGVTLEALRTGEVEVSEENGQRRDARLARAAA
jgi:hypothetical protein